MRVVPVNRFEGFNIELQVLVQGRVEGMVLRFLRDISLHTLSFNAARCSYTNSMQSMKEKKLQVKFAWLSKVVDFVIQLASCRNSVSYMFLHDSTC